MNASAGACLLVEIGGSRRRVDVTSVREVVRAPVVARVPSSPPWVRGIATLRGRLIPVVDLADRDAPVAGAGAAYLVVIAIGDRSVGIVVDRVGSVVDAGQESDVPAVDLSSFEERA